MPAPINRTVRRETAAVYRGRPLIVELHPGYLRIHEKGRRTSVDLDYRTAFETAYKILARAAEAEKRKERKARRAR